MMKQWVGKSKKSQRSQSNQRNQKVVNGLFSCIHGCLPLILLVILPFVLQSWPAQAGVVADPNAGLNKPLIDRTANGRELVQIVTPNSAGLSHNKYTFFNIDPAGAILNNSRTNANTQLGGWVAPNAFLANGPARVILNEVTSSNRSYLNGFMEVAGSRADVIVAIPNGITCSGCGFINATRGVLTTGTSVIDGSGNLDGFRVTRGDIVIGPGGFSDRATDQVDFFARSIAVNNEIWANKLNIITGANYVNYVNLGVQVIEGEGGKPVVAIDSAQLGGMYANKIMLMGTEKGLGVNLSGVNIAMGGDFTLTNDGKIVLNNNITAKGNVSVTSSDAIENKGVLYAYQNAALQADSALSNTGTIAAGGNMTLTGASVYSNGVLGAGIKEDGTLKTSGDMTIVSADKAELKNQTIAGGALSVTAMEIDLSGSKTQAGGEARFTATTGGINNSNGIIGVNGNLYFNAVSIDNRNGQIWGGSDMSLAAINGIDNREGKIFSYGNLTADTSSSSINNTAGGIGAGIDLTVHAGSVLNGSGKMAADRDVSITAAALTGSGEVVSGRDLTLNLTGLFINEAGGLLKANNNLNLNLTATGSVANYGVISAVESLGISGGSLVNETDAKMEANNINLNLADTVVNRGLISGVNAVNINTGAFSNYKTVFADALTVTADNISNEGDAAILGATSLINSFK